MSRNRPQGGNGYDANYFHHGNQYPNHGRNFNVSQRTQANNPGRSSHGTISRQTNYNSNHVHAQNHRNYEPEHYHQVNNRVEFERQRNPYQNRSNNPNRRDPFDNFFHHHDEFGMQVDSPWQRDPFFEPIMRVQERNNFFSEFENFFDNFHQQFIPRPSRNRGFTDLIPSINFYLDSGIRRTSNRRRRDQGLLEIFFGQFGNHNAFDFDPMHNFFNSRQSRGLDIAEILGQLTSMASGSGQHANPGNFDRLRNVNITTSILADNKVCTVCQEDFKLNETVKKLPCNHYFHEDCITPWLQSQNTCPTCRATI